jgi:hypothetical protein
VPNVESEDTVSDAGLRAQIEQFVDELFTNGMGQQAVRLVLIDAQGRDLGGWGKGPLTDRIEGLVAADRIAGMVVAAAPSPDPVAPRAPGAETAPAFKDYEVELVVTALQNWGGGSSEGFIGRIRKHLATPQAPGAAAETALEQNLGEALFAVGLQQGATVASLQRRLRVDAANAMRLLSLREAITAYLSASRAPAQAPDAAIEEAERLLKDITPGEWKWFDYPDGRKLLAGETRAVIHCPDAPMSCDTADAAFIAAAPRLVRQLLAALSSPTPRAGETP